jgi:transcription antitermination factor NusG
MEREPFNLCCTDPWLVLKTKSRHEKVVENALQERSINCFLPKHKVKRRWKRTSRMVEIPLFPEYVFVQPLIQQVASMRCIRGSCGFVLFGNEPAKMPLQELEALKVLVYSGADLEADARLIPGKRVRIKGGVFLGVEGELIHIKNRDILVLNVGLMHSCVRVEVERELIEIID